MRLLVVTLIALGALLAAAACEKANATVAAPVPVEQSFRTEGVPSLRLQFDPNTSLTVKPGEPSQVLFTGTRYEGMELTFEQKDGAIIGKSSGNVADKTLHITLAVPPKANLEVTGSRVDVDLRGVSGAHVFKASRGAVVVTGSEGKLRVETTEGAVRLRDVKGEVSVQTTTGGVTLRGAQAAKVAVTTVSGSVSLEGSGKAVEIKTDSGPIYLSQVQSDQLRLTTGSGLVAVLGFQGNLNATLKDGIFSAIDVKAGDVAVTSETGGVHLDQVTGNLTLATATGDIQVLRATNTAVMAKTEGGAITFEGSVAKGSLSILETKGKGKGDIQVAVPKGSNLRVRAQTASGRVSNSLPGSFPIQKSWYVEGVLGSWDASLDAVTLDGSITLELHEGP